MKKISGKLILTEPVTHGALEPDLDKRSNAIEIRKIPVLNRETGDFVMVPTISGNSIKNSTRRQFLEEVFQALGITSEGNIPLDVIYFFFAGGTTSNASPKPPSQKEFKNLRETLPFLDLLGGSYKGHFFRSQMLVSFAIPAVKETVALYPEVELTENIPTAAELASTIVQHPIGYTKMALEGTKEGLDEDEKAQMIYFTEALPVGVILYHDFGLRKGANKRTTACFYAFIKTFIEEGRLGGSSSKGHGAFEAHYFEDGEELSIENLEEKAKPFWDYITHQKDKIVETIKKIPEVLQAKEKASKQEDEQK